jgi:hypothetical protein
MALFKLLAKNYHMGGVKKQGVFQYKNENNEGSDTRRSLKGQFIAWHYHN